MAESGFNSTLRESATIASEWSSEVAQVEVADVAVESFDSFEAEVLLTAVFSPPRVFTHGQTRARVGGCGYRRFDSKAEPNEKVLVSTDGAELVGEPGAELLGIHEGFECALQGELAQADATL